MSLSGGVTPQGAAARLSALSVSMPPEEAGPTPPASLGPDAAALQPEQPEPLPLPLPLEIVADIITLLDQSDMAAVARASSALHDLALPLLYRRIAIPPVAPGIPPHDVRDGHARRALPGLRGPHPQLLGGRIPGAWWLPPRKAQAAVTAGSSASASGSVSDGAGSARARATAAIATAAPTPTALAPASRATTATAPAPPRTRPALDTLVRDLVIAQHEPGAHCVAVPLTLRTLHLLPGTNAELHRVGRAQDMSAFLDLMQRGQARGWGNNKCALLERLRVETLIVHRVGLLYSRLRPTLLGSPPAASRSGSEFGSGVGSGVASGAAAGFVVRSRVILLIPPDRATAGSTVKFEYPWASGAGVLGFLEAFKPDIEGVLVFDTLAGERWRPIPRPKDGDEDGVPLWIVRLVRSLARGAGARQITLVNLVAALEQPEAMESVRALAQEMVRDHGGTPLKFLAREEWDAGQGRCVGSGPW